MAACVSSDRIETRRQFLIENLTRQFLSLGVETVLLGGSVLRGDAISLSDLDLYLRLPGGGPTDALSAYRSLAEGLVWPQLRRLHAAGLCGIQVRFAHPDMLMAPGLLKVVGGLVYPIRCTSDDQLEEEAQKSLQSLTWKRYYLEYLLHAGGDWAIRLPRLVMIDVFPALRSLLIVGGRNPTLVWQMTKEQVVDICEKQYPAWQCRRYYTQLVYLSPALPDMNAGLRCALAGIKLLEDISNSQGSDSGG